MDSQIWIKISNFKHNFIISKTTKPSSDLSYLYFHLEWKKTDTNFFIFFYFFLLFASSQLVARYSVYMRVSLCVWKIDTIQKEQYQLFVQFILYILYTSVTLFASGLQVHEKKSSGYLSLSPPIFSFPILINLTLSTTIPWVIILDNATRQISQYILNWNL